MRAEEAVEQAIADEDAAEARVQAAAAALLPGAAGPSGVVIEESPVKEG